VDRYTPAVADVIDLADIFRSVRNRWLTVVAFTLGGAAVALAIVLLAPPVFSANASLLLKTASGGGGIGSSLSSVVGSLAEGAGGAAMGGGILSGMKAEVETEIEILKSRGLASRVVDSLRLQAQVTSPRSIAARHAFASLSLPGSFKAREYEFTQTGSGSARQYRFAAKDDSGTVSVGRPVPLAIGSVTVAPSAPREFTVVFRDREDAVTRFGEHLTFDKTKTDVAHFTYAGDDSISAAEAPNLLMDLYLDLRKGVDRGLNERSAEFLAKKLDSVGTALSAAERALRQQREATNAVEPLEVSATEYVNENRVRQQLLDVQLQERTLQQLVDQIAAGKATPVQLASYPQYIGSGPINTLVNTLVSVKTERQALLGTVTEEDERVKALATREKQLETQLMPLARTTLATYEAQRTDLAQRLKKIQETLIGMPRAAEQYGRLEREILDLGQIYAGLQVKLVDARLNAISEGGNIRALDPAVVPKKPSFPKPPVTMAAGLGAGLFTGLLVAVLLGILGGRMYDAQDIERRIGLPAVRFERTEPLLVGSATSRTIIVAPVEPRAQARPVAERLVETALSRSMTATLLELSNIERPALTTTAPTAAGNGLVPAGFDANAAIRRLEETHDVVVVQLPSLTSHVAGAVLDASRPVILVTPERRIARTGLQSAVDLLRRVGAPCAGVVLHGDDRRGIRA
jgi:tyrosine-protein kinase Etk/Wzc